MTVRFQSPRRRPSRQTREEKGVEISVVPSGQFLLDAWHTNCGRALSLETQPVPGHGPEKTTAQNGLSGGLSAFVSVIQKARKWRKHLQVAARVQQLRNHCQSGIRRVLSRVPSDMVLSGTEALRRAGDRPTHSAAAMESMQRELLFANCRSLNLGCAVPKSTISGGCL